MMQTAHISHNPWHLRRRATRKRMKSVTRTESSGTITGGCTMRRFLVLAVAILAVSLAATTFAGDAAAGKVVYDGAKPACKGCHTDVKNPLAPKSDEAPIAEEKRHCPDHP